MVCVGFGSTLSFGVPLAAAAAGALFVQAASQAYDAADEAAEAVLGRVADWGDELARAGDERADAALTNRRWHMAAADAVGANVALRLIRLRARQLGVAVELPRPLELDGLSLAEVGAWLDRARPLLRAARATLNAAVEAAEWQRLTAGLPAANRPAVTAALRRHQQALAARHTTTPTQTPPDLSWADAEVSAALSRLQPDADVDGRDAALQAAARVAQQAEDADAEAYLWTLEALVKQANARAVGRRRAAGWLEGLETPAVARAIAIDPDPARADLVARLRAVVAGTTELTTELQREGQDAARRAADLVIGAYRLGLLADELRKLGYRTEPDGETRVRVTRPEWGSDQVASVWLGADGDAHFRMDDLAGATGDDATATAAGRNAGFDRDVRAALHELSHDGVHNLVARPHEMQHHQHAEAAASTTTVTRPTPMRERPVGR